MSKIDNNWWRDPVFIGIVVLTGTLCLGIGLFAARENAGSKELFWIEQLPASELPGSFATTSSSSVPITEATKPAPKKASEPDPRASQVAAVGSALAPAPTAPVSTPATAHTYVAARTGKSYYLPSCAAVKRIKEENKVWFASAAEAKKAGYTASTHCKGM